MRPFIIKVTSHSFILLAEWGLLAHFTDEKLWPKDLNAHESPGQDLEPAVWVLLAPITFYSVSLRSLFASLNLSTCQRKNEGDNTTSGSKHRLWNLNSGSTTCWLCDSGPVP